MLSTELLFILFVVLVVPITPPKSLYAVIVVSFTVLLIIENVLLSTKYPAIPPALSPLSQAPVRLSGLQSMVIFSTLQLLTEP